MPLSCEQSLQLLQKARRIGRLSHAHILAGSVDQIMENLVVPLLRDMLGAEPIGHPDVHVVQPKSKSRQIVVEDIEELIVKLNQTTFYSGGYRFALLLHADRMNTVTANKLLKTLEEPYPRTHVFLITEQPAQLLPTVRSRCGLLLVKSPRPVPDDDVRGLICSMLDGSLQDPLKALLWARDVEQYLLLEKKKCEREILEHFKEGLKMLEADSREEKEAEMMAAATALYSEKRAALFSHLIAAVGPTSAAPVLLLEEAHAQMLKNLQDAVVLENLALKISQALKPANLRREILA